MKKIILKSELIIEHEGDMQEVINEFKKKFINFKKIYIDMSAFHYKNTHTFEYKIIFNHDVYL